MHKRLLAVALLLAAALAAAGGDEIKWTRSKALTYVPPDAAEETVTKDLEDLSKIYTLDYTGSSTADIAYLRITYYSWDLYYAGLKSLREQKKLDDETFKKAVTEARETLSRKNVFYVTVGANDPDLKRLSNKLVWEIYGLNGDLKTQPSSIERVENSHLGTIYSTRFIGSGTTTLKNIILNTYYIIELPTAPNDIQPESVRLVLVSEKFKRGFEWRFKQPK